MNINESKYKKEYVAGILTYWKNAAFQKMIIRVEIAIHKSKGEDVKKIIVFNPNTKEQWLLHPKIQSGISFLFDESQRKLTWPQKWVQATKSVSFGFQSDVRPCTVQQNANFTEGKTAICTEKKKSKTHMQTGRRHRWKQTDRTSQHHFSHSYLFAFFLKR